MDILITFEDGTTELRPADSPAFAPGARLFPEPATSQIEGGIGKLLSFSTTCGSQAHSFGLAYTGRSHGTAIVWCETGERAEGRPLTGEWRSCRVESLEEQVQRLTRERDAARQRLTDLRQWAMIERATEEAALRHAVIEGLAGSNHAARRESRARAFDAVLRRIEGQSQ